MGSGGGNVPMVIIDGSKGNSTDGQYDRQHI